MRLRCVPLPEPVRRSLGEGGRSLISFVNKPMDFVSAVGCLILRLTTSFQLHCFTLQGVLAIKDADLLRTSKAAFQKDSQPGRSQKKPR